MIALSSERELRVLDQISDTEGIAESMVYRHASSGDGVVGIIPVRESIPVGNCKTRELEADKNVLDSAGNIVRRVVADIVNNAKPDQNREEEALPIGGKDDKFYAEELIEVS